MARGTVYRARDTVLDRVVAVKVINPPVTDDPEFLESLQREPRLAARLTHSNVVTVHDFQVEYGTAYIVMEFLPNSLDKHIRPEQLIPYRRASEIAIEVSRSFAHAHTQGVIHRDIKPGNILLTSGWGGSARLSWWDRSTIL